MSEEDVPTTHVLADGELPQVLSDMVRRAMECAGEGLPDIAPDTVMAPFGVALTAEGTMVIMRVSGGDGDDVKDLTEALFAHANEVRHQLSAITIACDALLNQRQDALRLFMETADGFLANLFVPYDAVGDEVIWGIPIRVDADLPVWDQSSGA